VLAYVSQERVKVYHEMNDNSNAYQIAGKLINAGIGQVGSECGEFEWTLWHTRLKWARWAILKIC
jgi:hypothetical protein